MSDTITKDSFIGSNKVLMVADTTLKTPLGADIVEVTYVNGAKERMPKKTYEIVVTDIASDASIQRETKLRAMAPAIVTVIEEYDVKVSEIQVLLQKVAAQIDNRFSRATNFALTHDDSQYIPNNNPLFDRSILEAEAIISTIPKVAEQPIPNATGTDNTNQAAPVTAA